MKVTKIECRIVLVPDYVPEAGSSPQDDIVVLVHTDAGITGIGEVDTNPWVAKARSWSLMICSSWRRPSGLTTWKDIDF